MWSDIDTTTENGLDVMWEPLDLYSCWLEDEERRLKTKKCRQILEAGKSTEIECPPKVLSFPGGSEVKASAYNAGDLGSIPGLGRSPAEGNVNPLQYSCLENPMDRGAWWAILHRVAKSWTQLSNFTLC